jgi:hypothetical protein
VATTASLVAEFQALMDDLLRKVGASRTTIRLDVPAHGFALPPRARAQSRETTMPLPAAGRAQLAPVQPALQTHLPVPPWVPPPLQ